MELTAQQLLVLLECTKHDFAFQRLVRALTGCDAKTAKGLLAQAKAIQVESAR